MLLIFFCYFFVDYSFMYVLIGVLCSLFCFVVVEEGSIF